MNQRVRPQAVESTVKLVEALAGMVERVTFHNAENGFCVLKVQAGGKRNLVTVVDYAPSIGAGEWITATGAWVSDRVYGLQFRANVAAGNAQRTAKGDWHRGQRRQHQTAMD
jgi:exodeoxyribonuclease V alpha subunit